MTCAERVRRRWRAWLAVACVALAGCTSTAERVNVRVRNDSPLAWQGMWLGAGGPTGGLHDFGPLAPGMSTAYVALPATLADYRKSDVLVRPGLRLGNVVRPEAHGLPPVLAPGFYTFAYRIERDALVMDIRRDR